jgi:methylenetetrahydrofolate reductase (NADPH)
VDEATFARMDGHAGDQAEAAGIQIAVDVVRRLREVPGVAGVHLMAPGWAAAAVPLVTEAVGLRAAGTG